MRFYERFESLMKERGLTVAEVSRATGIPYTTLDSYVKKKQSYTSMENVIKLAEYFGVTMEWLATGKEKKDTQDDVELSQRKKKAIEMVSKLTPEEEKAVMAFLNTLFNMREN